MWASTALVGSSRTRTSGSARSAAASTTRWRCPPERLRATLGKLGVEAVGKAFHDVAGGGGLERFFDGRGVASRPSGAEARHVDRLGEGPGEQLRLAVDDEHVPPHHVDRQLVDPDACDRDPFSRGRVHVAAQARGHLARLVGVGGDHGGQRPGATSQARCLLSEIGPVGASRYSDSGLGRSGSRRRTESTRPAATVAADQRVAASIRVWMGSSRKAAYA